MQFKVALMVPDVSTMIGRFFDIQLDYDVTIINVIGQERCSGGVEQFLN